MIERFADGGYDSEPAVSKPAFWDCGCAVAPDKVPAEATVCDWHFNQIGLSVPAPVMPVSALRGIDKDHADQASRFFIVDRKMNLVGATATEQTKAYLPIALAALRPYAGRKLPDVVHLGEECRLLLLHLANDAYGGATIVFIQTPRLSAALRRATETYNLTEREGAVLRLAAESRSNAEIANDLFIAASTVSDHVQNMFRKMECSRRNQMLNKLFFY
jgi:DNA-binding CsgD family transcriptional regulator